MLATLFHAIEPDSGASQHDYVNFRRLAALSVKETHHCERLTANVWLVTEEDVWLSLHRLLELSRQNAIGSRTLEFDLESQWQNHPSPV
jgi:hypothetical protein